MIPYQQGLLHGRGRDLVILEKENVNDGHGNYSKYQCIEPFNKNTVFFLPAFPEGPVHLLADVYVKNDDQAE
jgi:hypothetical protein